MYMRKAPELTLLTCKKMVLSGGLSVVARVLLNVRPTLPWGGGGWVGLAEFQGGWVSNHPPPPQGRVGLCGGLGSIEPVPLLSFFCCRFTSKRG